MLSRARTMFRKLHGSSSRSSRGNEPIPPAPATTTEIKPVGPPPRAMHYNDWKQSLINSPRKTRGEKQEIAIFVANAKDASNYSLFHKLLQIEKGDYCFDPTEDYLTDFFCDDYVYTVSFWPPLDRNTALLSFIHHICFVFTYDASSKESWDEMAVACQEMRSRCKDGVLPFLATMIAAMGEGETAVSHSEAEAFATQQNCLFVQFSPRNGRGICDAVCSLVERAHAVRDQYSMGQKRPDWNYERVKVIVDLSSSLKSLSQDHRFHV